MLSILMLSKEQEHIGIAKRLVEEGHAVKIYTEDAADHNQGWDGVRICSNQREWAAGLETADIVILPERYPRSAVVPYAAGRVFGGGLAGIKGNTGTIARLLEGKVQFDTESEIWLGGLFNKGAWSLLHVSYQYYRMLEGDRGVSTPNEGVVAKFLILPMHRSCLMPLSSLLEGYTGWVEVGGVVKDGYFLVTGINLNLGPGVLASLCEGIGSLGQVLYHGGGEPLGDDFMMSVRVSKPGHPFVIMPSTELELDQEAAKHFWPGVDSVYGFFTSRGKTVDDARRRAYRSIRYNVVDPSIQYRRDIGYAAGEMFKCLLGGRDDRTTVG